MLSSSVARPSFAVSFFTCLLALLCAAPLSAQPRAVLVDGSGPWSDAQWTSTVSQFSALLNDAGYTVNIVSPENLAAALDSPDILAAVPSLESLPFDAFTAITTHVYGGGGLMASGGQPFRDALYRTPDGRWLDAAAYLQAVGSAPPQGPYVPYSIPTISPAKEQYTNAAGFRVPVARGRGLFSYSASSGRYRVIGDLLAPAATIYLNSTFSLNPKPPFTQSHSFVVWLPSPQLFEPYRTQLIAALKAAPARVSLYNGGADQILWLPGEPVTGKAVVVNGNSANAQATLQWSVSGPTGVTPQPATVLTMAPGEAAAVPFNLVGLAPGDYTLQFRLLIGNQEVDRLDGPVRVLDPTVTRQAGQKIRVVNGAFVAGGRHVYLRGVNYWPRYTSGQDFAVFNGQSWLEAGQYDPDLIEADLTEIAGLGFNLLNIQFSDLEGFWAQEGRDLIDFLERCRNHGIWVQIALQVSRTNAAYAGQISPLLESYLQAAYLPGNDRVFAYDLLWEPMVGTHDTGGQGKLVNGMIVYNTGRTVLDGDWRNWVNDQYGSVAAAQAAWGYPAPLAASGQLTNPSDDQMQNDGPWRVMVAAYRRFLDDYLGRNLGLIARQLRRSDPDTLLTYRNWTTMNSVHNANTGYDIGTAAAHLDFLSPERYSPVLPWPDARVFGLITAYTRYRSGGKPVVWAEFGADVGASGGTTASRTAQAAICDTMMRQVADDGSNGASVWWWPGGWGPLDGTDFGITDPDGTPRPCAKTLSQGNATFAAAAPDLTQDPLDNVTVDRDTDARGAYGLFLNTQDRYMQSRQASRSVSLNDAGTGTDTSTMPLVQVGNVAYAGSGPMKFANSEFAGLHVVCPNLDVTVENGSSLAIPSGGACQVTPVLVNTGEAQWLPGTASSRGVVLHTNIGDLPVPQAVASLQPVTMGTLTFTMGPNAAVLSGRMKIAGAGDFGEALNVTLSVDSSGTGACATSLSPAATALSAPVPGTTGTIKINTSCVWTASVDQPWINLSTTKGSGNGVVSYTIAANYGPPRQATIQIGSYAFAVTQAAPAVPPQAATPGLSATSLSFDATDVGSAAAPQRIQLANPGPGALHLLGITPGGLNSSDFSETNDCGATLAPGQLCTIQVTFTPAVGGLRTGSLFIAGNTAGSSVVNLSGTGVDAASVPTIQTIVDTWGYTQPIAPGLWVAIVGTNLGGPPQLWDLKGGQTLPVSVGGATVTFNGTPAALLYVSPTQINALVPANVAPGKVQVVVQVNGVSSVPFSATAQAAHPAVYAPPSADGSTFYVTANLAGTAAMVGNAATDPRVTRAVYPGEGLDLYMIGLGATSDPSKFVTDQVFSGGFPVSATVTASVGGESANVIFAGLTSPGLYLVRIAVPSDLKPGAQPLQVSVGGIVTRPSLVLPVAAAPAP
ncbi:MAG TPA: choice-of-anchor D domain-containing protein [Bryobacteraceae bacterium]|jgi:uncharacterized protein (TIGR03437 family)